MKISAVLVLTALGTLIGCANNGGGGIAIPAIPSLVSQGSGGTAASGAAAGSTSVNSNVERCAQSLGTLAVADGRDQGWYSSFQSKTGAGSLEPIVRLLAQQSNCFVVTSIGNSQLQSELDRITQQTRNSGEYRAGSNYQTGQRVAADYYLSPTILYAGESGGGIGASLGTALGGSILGDVGAVLGGAALNQKSTSVTMSLLGIREGVQIAASEGSATASDLGAFTGALGGSGGGVLGGYSRTPEGKATAAAFVDAFNKLVVALRGYKAQNVEGGLGTGGTLQIN